MELHARFEWVYLVSGWSAFDFLEQDDYLPPTATETRARPYRFRMRTMQLSIAQAPTGRLRWRAAGDGLFARTCRTHRDVTTADNQHDGADRCDVGERIAGHREKVRIGTFDDPALAVGDAAGAGRQDRGRAQRVHWLHADVNKRLKSIRQHIVRLPRRGPAIRTWHDSRP